MLLALSPFLAIVFIRVSKVEKIRKKSGLESY
jgi:hypothetical protein